MKDGAVMKNAPIVAGIADKDPAVVAYAEMLADEYAAPLLLVHAYEVPPSAWGSVYGLDVPQAFRDGAEQAMQEAVSAVRRRNRRALVEGRVKRGRASLELARLSSSARTVVIGQDSRQPWFVRLFQGNTARHLAGHTHCPLVVVPDSWERGDDRGAVVVLLDGVARPDAALHYAFDRAERQGRGVRVVQVDTPVQTSSDLEASRERLSRLIDPWRSRFRGIRVQTTVLQGEPTRVAIDSERSAALLVISGSVGEPHLWPATPLVHAIARESSCPVAVVPSTLPH